MATNPRTYDTGDTDGRVVKRVRTVACRKGGVWRWYASTSPVGRRPPPASAPLAATAVGCLPSSDAARRDGPHPRALTGARALASDAVHRRGGYRRLHGRAIDADIVKHRILLVTRNWAQVARLGYLPRNKYGAVSSGVRVRLPCWWRVFLSKGECMLRLLAGQAECLWDDALPVEVRELPASPSAPDDDPGRVRRQPPSTVPAARSHCSWGRDRAAATASHRGRRTTARRFPTWPTTGSS